MEYSKLFISERKAVDVAKELYNIEGRAKALPGDSDFNFKIKSKSQSYILKISRPDEDIEFVDFQRQVLECVNKSNAVNISPILFKDKTGKTTSSIIDEHGNKRIVRLLSWIDGRLWSSVNPITDKLLFNLGEQAGCITQALKKMDHPYSHR